MHGNNILRNWNKEDYDFGHYKSMSLDDKIKIAERNKRKNSTTKHTFFQVASIG